MSWAWEQKCPNIGTKAVLVALANFANESGYCYPGQETLAAMVSGASRTVRSHLAALESAGLIRRQARHDSKGHRTSDAVWLLMSNRQELPPGGGAYRQVSHGLPAKVSGEPSVEPSVDDGEAAREAAPLEIVSGEGANPSAEPSNADKVAVIAALDASIVETWGQERGRPWKAATDFEYARRYLASGAPLDLLAWLFKNEQEKRKRAGKHDPIVTLKYFEGIVGEALQEQNRPPAEVVPIRPGAGRRQSYSETSLRGMGAALAKRQATEPDAGG